MRHPIRLRLLLLVLTLALVPRLALAQPTYRLAWDFPNTTPAAITAYAYTLKIDTAAPIAVTATCAANATTPTTTSCTSPLPILARGAHVLTLTVSADGTSVDSDPYATHPPGKPANLSITVTVTISQ